MPISLLEMPFLICLIEDLFGSHLVPPPQGVADHMLLCATLYSVHSWGVALHALFGSIFYLSPFQAVTCLRLSHLYTSLDIDTGTHT